MNNTTNTCTDIATATRKLHVNTPNNFRYDEDTACVDLAQIALGEVDMLHNSLAAQGRWEWEHPNAARKMTETEITDFYAAVAEATERCHRLYNWAAFP